jgi:hypothetical protein
MLAVEGSREGPAEESTDFSNPQKTPYQAEKDRKSQETLFQAGVLILRLSRRLQRKAAAAPKMGSGPGTGGGPGPEGVKTRELVLVELESELLNEGDLEKSGKGLIKRLVQL